MTAGAVSGMKMPPIIRAHIGHIAPGPAGPDAICAIMALHAVSG